MEPIKPSDRRQILAAQPDSEAEIAEHEQLLAERFLHDPDMPAAQGAPDPAADLASDVDVLPGYGADGGAAPDALGMRPDLDDLDDLDAVAPAARDPRDGHAVERASSRRAQREARLRELHRKLYGPPRTR